MQKTSLLFLFSFLALATAFILDFMLATLPPPPPIQAPLTIFVYSFNSPGILNETGSMRESTSPYFWLNSGGELVITGGVGETMLGNALAGDYWHDLYARDNPVDTDGGTHPQNLFRLVTKSQWSSVSEQAGFYIAKDNFSASPNRNASNGLLLMSRYAMGGQTLYYAGVRVDGTAVIKKKIKGTYYTLAQSKIFSGTYNGSQDAKNLIPEGAWISLRSDTVTNSNGSVTVTLYMELPGETQWKQLLVATDSGQYGATAPILGPGYQGIRTDFMDVEFSSLKLLAL